MMFMFANQLFCFLGWLGSSVSSDPRTFQECQAVANYDTCAVQCVGAAGCGVSSSA